LICGWQRRKNNYNNRCQGWILNATLRPCNFLSEVDLARQCETSRTPVREDVQSAVAGKGHSTNPAQRIRNPSYLDPRDHRGRRVQETTQLKLTLEYVRQLDVLSTPKDK
jgi:hypothetical protein